VQIVVLANDFLTKNSKYFLRRFKNHIKVENLLSFCLNLLIYSTKVTLIKDEYNRQ